MGCDQKPTTMTIPEAAETDPIGNFIREHNMRVVYNPSSKLKPGMELGLIGFINTTGIDDVWEPEQSIPGKEVLKRLHLLEADISLEDATLLFDEQRSMPEDWRSYYILTSFVCKDAGGIIQTLYLYWDVVQWGWDFFRVIDVFDARCRGVRSANNPNSPKT